MVSSVVSKSSLVHLSIPYFKLILGKLPTISKTKVNSTEPKVNKNTHEAIITKEQFN
jgi:hypothetical protein